jgi:4-carboxymuconolactone decarboxylase
MRDALFDKGLRLRKQVIGAEYVERSMKNADRYAKPIQELATKAAWGLVWARPGIPHQWRSVLNLGMLVALNMPHELKLHIRVALRNGLTREQVSECLLQTAIYCGFPAALAAFRVMQEAFAEEDRLGVAQRKPRRRRK